MVLDTTTPNAEPEVDDRSMRIIEYALAFVAVLVAGVLAFIR